MRKSVGTIGTMLVAGLLGATAQQAQLLAMTEEHPLATNLQDISEKAADDDASPLSAESVKRLKDIGAGQYQITPTREDVPLVLRALRDKDLTISSHACLAVETMSPMNLFRPEDLKTIWEGLRPKMRSQHDDTSEWSARGVGAIAHDSGLVARFFAKDQPWPLGRQPFETEVHAGVFLYGAFEETILMLSSNEPEMRRRGAVLFGRILKRLPQDKQESLVRALLAIPVATAAKGKADNAEARSCGMVARALIDAAPEIKTESLANDVAVRLLAAVGEQAVPDYFTTPGAGLRLIGLANLADSTSGETRKQIVRAVIASVADDRLCYSRTSGVYSPPKHAGAEALAILASFLTLEELEDAEKAIPPQAAGEKKEFYDSMYGAAKRALAARKSVVQQKPQLDAPEEEDVAFFEKKYQKKITGVKSKDEYSDPDQFYSAIGKQLGIPEIAWQAAAEKFGWKKDDGRQSFTILKGGPTAGGRQGSWDVLFIRSMINPETKRPDPASVEQVMVQIDYDGNITFPKIPKSKQ